MFNKSPYRLSLIVAGLAACGGEGTAPSPPPAPPPPPPVAPVQVGTIPNQTVETGQTATLEVASYFRDPDGGALTYTAASSAAGVVSVSLSGSILTMVGVADGTATVTVTARDPGGLTAAQSFSVTVETPNRAPEAVGTIPNQTVETGQTATLEVASYFRDPDGGALTYTAASSAAGVVSVSLSGSTLTMVGVADGTATVTVTARDPGGLTAVQSFSVTVETPNRAPEAVGTIPNQTVNAGSSSSVEVSSYFRDRDEDRLTYAAGSSNTAVATASVSGSRVTISAVAAGTATVTVTARDPGNLTATQRFGVTVRGGGAPDLVVSVSPSTVTVAPGGSFSYEATVRNAGGASSPATQVQTFVSADATISRSDTPLSGSRPHRVPALGLSESYSRTVAIDIVDSARPGTLYVGDCADAVSGESDTDNNCSSAVTVTIETGGGGAGFRDDFDSSASLSDWAIRNASAVVSGGLLRLTNSTSGRVGLAEHGLAGPLTSWTISASLGRVQEVGFASVWWSTGHSRLRTFALDIGTDSDGDNYNLYVFDQGEGSWLWVRDLSGSSSAIDDGPNELTEIVIGWEGEEFVAVAEGRELFRARLSGELAQALSRVSSIALVREASRTGIAALFDYVEVTGTAADGDGTGAQLGIESLVTAIERLTPMIDLTEASKTKGAAIKPTNGTLGKGKMSR